MKAAMEAMNERVTQQFKWSLPDTIAKECDDFIREHVAPEGRAHLLSQKGPIVEAAKAAADEIGHKIAANMAAKADEKLGRSYSADAIIKAIFG
jgi:hypothetical protein